jgi:hypothetical protein
MTRSGSGKPLKEVGKMSIPGSGAPRGLIRQGDVLLVPIDDLPANTPVEASGRLVLAEGETTGHAHVIDAQRARLVRRRLMHHGQSPTLYLVVDGVEAVSLTHEEHNTVEVPPGLYEVRRQKEYEPRRAARWVAD